MKRTIIAGVFLVVAGMVQARGDGGKDSELYFMVVFGHDGGGARFSHTWATFVQATPREDEDGEEDYQLDSHTISWMPASGMIRLLRPPEPGRNLDLKESLKLSRSLEARITMWGPFQIKKELFDRAVRQEARLKKGEIRYKALDGNFRPGQASNCIHAVSDIDRDRGLLDVGTAFGEPASRRVAQHFQRWIIRPEKTFAWVEDKLDLKKYTISRQTLSGTVVQNGPPSGIVPAAAVEMDR